ncbi:MAG: hypothetical protein ABJA69_08450 [Acidobacteriaceae bacterium]
MSYHVMSLTMAEVRQGGLTFQRELSASLKECRDLKVYSPSPFDLDGRKRAKDLFGGDVVYFFNEAARLECIQLGIEINFLAEIPDDQLPRRKTLVVGIPE